MTVNLSEEQEKQLEAERKRLSAAVNKKTYADDDKSLAAERSRLYQKVIERRNKEKEKTATVQSVKNNMLLNSRDGVSLNTKTAPVITPGITANITPVKTAAPTPIIPAVVPSSAPVVKPAIAAGVAKVLTPITIVDINRESEKAKTEVAAINAQGGIDEAQIKADVDADTAYFKALAGKNTGVVNASNPAYLELLSQVRAIATGMSGATRKKAVSYDEAVQIMLSDENYKPHADLLKAITAELKESEVKTPTAENFGLIKPSRLN
jgi:hypothetical protein